MGVVFLLRSVAGMDKPLKINGMFHRINWMTCKLAFAHAASLEATSYLLSFVLAAFV